MVVDPFVEGLGESLTYILAMGFWVLLRNPVFPLVNGLGVRKLAQVQTLGKVS